MLISSKIPRGTINHSNTDEHTSIGDNAERNNNTSAPDEPPIPIEPIADIGCKACNKCYLCRHYLAVCSEFSSYHTTQYFRHSSLVDCNSECIIYKIDCKHHEKSYVGYSINNMKTRFSNTKSHFKKKRDSCEIVKHLLEIEHESIDTSSIKTYDSSLSNYLQVTLIEKVKVEVSDTKAQKETKCEEREGYWQTQLKTLHAFGGLNKRDNRKYVISRK